MNIEGNPSTRQRNISNQIGEQNSQVKQDVRQNSLHLSNASTFRSQVLIHDEIENCTQLANSIAFVKGKQIRGDKRNGGQQIEQVRRQQIHKKGESFGKKRVSFEPKLNRKNQYYLAMFECCLCSQIFEDDDLVNFTKCVHRFCYKCGMEYIRMKLRDGLKIICPVENCGCVFVFNLIIKDYLSFDELEELNGIQGENREIMEQKDEIEISEEDEDIVDDENDGRDQGENLETDQNLIGESISTKHKLCEIEEIKELSPKKSNSVTFQMTRTPSKTLNNSQVPSRNQSPIANDSSFNNLVKRQHSFPVPRQLTFPEIIFKKICTKLWLKKWSRFFVMLPISVFVLCLFLISVAFWLIWVIVYFLVVWMVTIPLIWSGFEIYGCFDRSIKNRILKNVSFIVCLIGFPLMLLFFQMITFGIIIYYSLYSRDMGLILRGKKPLLFSCKKIILNPSYKFGDVCNCRVNKRC